MDIDYINRKKKVPQVHSREHVHFHKEALFGTWVYKPSLGGTTATVECVYKTRRHNSGIGIY